MRLNQIAQKLNQAFSTTSHLKTKHIFSKVQALFQPVQEKQSQNLQTLQINQNNHEIVKINSNRLYC